MDRIEAKRVLLDIFDKIDNQKFPEGEVGHPALYFFRSKEELENKIDVLLLSKESFDRYDIMYYSNYMIKYLLGPYDSHTTVTSKNSRFLPIIFKVIDGDVYVVKSLDNMSNATYGKLTRINGVSIDVIKKELEDIIPYSTTGYLSTSIAFKLSKDEILKSLPSIDNNCDKIIYTVLNNGEEKNYSFDLTQEYERIEDVKPRNYTYEIIDGVMVLHYTMCFREERMLEFIKTIESESRANNITKFVLDIRGNGGGNSRVSIPLLEFLKDKKFVTITDEEVFSSAIMLCIQIKRLGGYFIGTEVGSTISCFGDNSFPIEYPDLDLIIKRSYKYFYYDKDLNIYVYYKNTFTELAKDADEFKEIDKGLFTPDVYSSKTIDDYKNGTDKPLKMALEYLSRDNVKSHT